MKRLSKFYHPFLLLIISFSASYSFAQSGNSEIKGVVVFEGDKEPVHHSVIQVLRTDSSYFSGMETDSLGCYSLPLPPPGPFILKISFIGCDNAYRNLAVKEKRQTIVLDTISLRTNDILLRAAGVTAKLPEMEMNGDTLVYNASAYNIPEGEVLEELVKKLPGVEIDENGKITVNGKEVSEFRINGKDFFKGNNEIAMKNLPVELVSKIKSYEKKSDYAEQTGIDDGNERTVMDIQLKKELKESWISSLDLSLGSKDRFLSKLFANRFTDFNRMSITGNAGNNDGRSISRQLGTDVSFTSKKKRKEAGYFEIGGNITANSRQGNNKSWSNNETFISSGASSSFSNTLNSSRSRSKGLSGRLDLRWLPDTLTTITFTPNFSWSQSENGSSNRSVQFNSDPYKVDGVNDPLEDMFPDNNPFLHDIAVNRRNNRSMSDGTNTKFDFSLMLVRRLNKKGRNISLDLSASSSKDKNESFSISNTDYYLNTRNPFTYQNQYTHSPSRSWNINTRASYSEPILKGLHLSVNYQFTRNFSDRDRSLYELDSLPSWREDSHELGELPQGKDSLEWALNLFNSQYSEQRDNTHRVNFGLRWTTDLINFNVGANFRKEDTELHYQKSHIDTLLTRNIFRFNPDARLRIRFSRDESIDFRYRGTSSEPSLTNKLADTDNSDPLNIHTGNAHLKPSWRNNFDLSYNKYFTLTRRSLTLSTNYQQSSNDISTAVVYNELTGGRHTHPENINGNWSAGGGVQFHTPLDQNNSFHLSSDSRVNYNNSVGYLSTNANKSSSKNQTRSTSLSERLNLRYRNDWLEAGLGGRINYRHSSNKLRPQSNTSTYDFSYQLNTRIKFPWKMYLSSSVDLSSRRGYSVPSMNKDEWIWNAEISQNFFKGAPLIVKINVYDILHQRSNISQSINANSRNESQTNASYSYFMTHLIFRCNIFNGKVAFGFRKAEKGGVRNQSSGGRSGRGGFGGGRGR